MLLLTHLLGRGGEAGAVVAEGEAGQGGAVGLDDAELLQPDGIQHHHVPAACRAVRGGAPNKCHGRHRS